VNREGKLYRPVPESHQRYRELYAHYEKLYPSIREFYRG
jgi:hypothetical protein